MRAGLKAVLLLDCQMKLLNHTLVQMDALLAASANQMMVMLTWLDQLVPLLPIAKINPLHQSQINQKLERSVHSSQARSARLTLSQDSKYLLSAGQLASMP